jgi:hypothetical protein
MHRLHVCSFSGDNVACELAQCIDRQSYDNRWQPGPGLVGTLIVDRRMCTSVDGAPLYGATADNPSRTSVANR